MLTYSPKLTGLDGNYFLGDGLQPQEAKALLDANQPPVEVRSLQLIPLSLLPQFHLPFPSPPRFPNLDTLHISLLCCCICFRIP